MDIKEKSIIYEKRIECVLGILFLVPPFLGVFFFLLSLCDVSGDFVDMTDLSGQWDWQSVDYGVSMSPAPLYLGLMAIAGAFLIKNSLRYVFFKCDEDALKRQEPNGKLDSKPETDDINDILGINNKENEN